MEHRRQRVQIPQRFFSSETAQPFSNCISCDRFLLLDGTHYYIEKAVKRIPDLDAQDVIFEYAMCAECYAELWASLSEESVSRIEQYFTERAETEDRLVAMSEQEASGPTALLDACLITGTPLSELTEYQMVCQCEGSFLEENHMPMLISGVVMDAVADLLSNKTIDVLGGFMDDHFGLPPELRPLFKETDLLII